QKPCDSAVDGAAPEPGCFCRGGTAYCPTVRIEFVRLRLGEAEFSEDVLVSFQTRRSVEVPVPGVQLTPEVHCASSPASELRKYSVPPLSVLNWVPGDCAGQTVKPGWPPTPEWLVSNCVTSIVAAPDTSADFDIA